MGDFAGKIDVERLVSYSDDLVAVLKDKKDVDKLTQCLEQFKVLKTSCDADSNEARSQLQEYQKKIDEYMQKTEKAKSEVSADAELELLQKELEAELENERVLAEELRVINSEINDLERQRISAEELKQTLKKVEQDELRAQRKLSMYACVTNIIPNFDDHSKISGHIVDRDKRRVEKFEVDPTEVSTFDTCQSIWNMVNLR
uniref:Kinetochore protein Spc24 n=2 Tax=Rhizophora mucronata TaxID=61149 RepID=A0A2P2K1U5_RHIMU